MICCDHPSSLWKTGNNAVFINLCDLKVRFVIFKYDGMLRALEEPSVIVMDNASYHSRTENKLPKLYWKKELKLQFMEEHNIIDNIETAKKNTKEQLLQIIQENSQIKLCKMKGTKFQNHSHLYDTVFIDILAAYTYINF